LGTGRSVNDGVTDVIALTRVAEHGRPTER
jgi:hypothetical protein